MKKNSACNNQVASVVFSFGSRQVRTFDLNGEIWFVLSDVTSALGFSRSRDASRMLEDDEKGAHIVRTPGGKQEVTIISEPGLYRLTLNSRKEEAKRFARWVTHEVLPAIRKTGTYTQKGAIVLTESEATNLAGLLDLVPIFKDVQQRAEAMMREAKSPMAGKMRDAWNETGLFAWALREVGERCRVVREECDRKYMPAH